MNQSARAPVPDAAPKSFLSTVFRPAVAIPLLLFLMLNSSPFIVRAIRLGSVPDIGEPFDVAEFGKVDLADSENAFTWYKKAVAQLKPGTDTNNKEMATVMQSGWGAGSEELSNWLKSNAEAIETYRQGSQQNDGMVVRPLDYTYDTTLSVIQELRSLTRLALLETVRRENAGDYDGSWQLQKAVYRSSRHAGTHGTIIGRLVGAAMTSIAAESTLRWSANPDVNSTQLQQAMTDLRESYKLTAPASTGLKIEFMTCQKAMRDPKVLAAENDYKWMSTPFGKVRLYISGEPEVSERVLKLVFANYLAQCDLPIWKRTPMTPQDLFALDPNVPSGEQHAPAEIAIWLSKSVLAKALLPAASQVIEAITREQSRQTGLLTALALQVHYRKNGQFPEQLNALLQDGLDELPVDPFSVTQETLQYQLNAEGAKVSPHDKPDYLTLNVLVPGTHPTTKP